MSIVAWFPLCALPSANSILNSSQSVSAPLVGCIISVPCLAQSPAFYAFFVNPLFAAPCTTHLLPVLAFVNCPSRKLILVILLFYVDLVLEFYMLTKIGRIRITWGWSGKRVVMKLQSWSVNAFVRVSPSCWSVLAIVGVGPSWGRI
jgi:hypothetical protein